MDYSLKRLTAEEAAQMRAIVAEWEELVIRSLPTVKTAWFLGRVVTADSRYEHANPTLTLAAARLESGALAARNLLIGLHTGKYAFAALELPEQPGRYSLAVVSPDIVPPGHLGAIQFLPLALVLLKTTIAAAIAAGIVYLADAYQPVAELIARAELITAETQATAARIAATLPPAQAAKVLAQVQKALSDDAATDTETWYQKLGKQIADTMGSVLSGIWPILLIVLLLKAKK
jgi:hypothetical protein